MEDDRNPQQPPSQAPPPPSGEPGASPQRQPSDQEYPKPNAPEPARQPPESSEQPPQHGGPLNVGVPIEAVLSGASAPPQTVVYSLPQGGAPLITGAITQSVQVWQGQYPPPDALERYEALSPGAFDRMMRMAEQLQAAQIENSRRALEYTRSDSRRAHWLGWATTVLAMGGALCSLWLGNGWVASAFLSVPVMAVARALIESGKRERHSSPNSIKT